MGKDFGQSPDKNCQYANGKDFMFHKIIPHYLYVVHDMQLLLQLDNIQTNLVLAQMVLSLLECLDILSNKATVIIDFTTFQRDNTTPFAATIFPAAHKLMKIFVFTPQEACLCKELMQL